MKRLAFVVLLALLAGCRSQRPPSEEDMPITALPKYQPPTEPGPASVPDEFRYPKRVFDGGAVAAGKDAG